MKGEKETKETCNTMVTENFPHIVPDTNMLRLEPQR